MYCIRSRSSPVTRTGIFKMAAPSHRRLITAFSASLGLLLIVGMFGSVSPKKYPCMFSLDYRCPEELYRGIRWEDYKEGAGCLGCKQDPLDVNYANVASKSPIVWDDGSASSVLNDANRKKKRTRVNPFRFALQCANKVSIVT